MNYYSNNIRHVRGDTYSFGLVSEDEQFDSVYFTCRNGLNDNSPVLFQKSLVNGIGITETEETQEGTLYKYSVRIDPTDTEDINSGTYYYDLQIELNGDIFSIMKGRFIIEQDCTRNEIINDEIVLKINEINGEIVGVSTLDKLNYLEATKGLIKDGLNDLGAGISDNDTFRSYSGAIDSLYDYMKQTTDEGTEVTLSNTRVAKMKITPNGNSTQEILPSEYQQVEYIESTGTQYINTGYIPQINTKVEARFYETSKYENYPKLFGSEVLNQNQSFKVDLRNPFVIGYSNKEYTTNIGCSIETMYDISFQLNELKVNTDTYSFSNTAFTGTYPIFIFASNRAGSVLEYSAVRIYSFKIYTGTTLAMDFIPCYRKSDNVIGMYDTINNVFYINAGTGTFNKGDNIPNPSYKQDIKVVTGDNIITISNSDDSETQSFLLSLGDMEVVGIPNTDYKDKIFHAVNGNPVYDSLTSEEKASLTYGNWYKKEEIGKVTYTGADSENWLTGSYGTNSYRLDTTNGKGSTENSPILCMTNLFRGVRFADRSSGGNNIVYMDSNSTYIYIRNTTYTSVANFKTMLGTTNLIAYYVLATPTDIPITDTTLISQLNAIEKATSYEGTTVITSIYDEDNAQMILTATALTE